jgi:hypothetical protein
MNRLSSFIFNSSPDVPRLGSALRLGAWVIIGLVAIDTLINIVFSYPRDPKELNPGRLQSYFDYGRSQEGKLRRMTRPEKSETAPITLAGWYDPLQVGEPPANSGKRIVTFYGMSHAVNLAHALGRTSKTYVPRIVAGPGATANWSYGAYLRDRGGGTSRAVVLALMSGNLPMINTQTALTWNTDFAMPYTGDRFVLKDGQLQAIHPPYSSFDQYVQALYDQKKWAEALDEFAKYDSIYDAFIVRASFLDHSAFVRLFRRAYAQRIIRDARHAVLDRRGFNPDSDAIKVAQKMVQEFAAQARRDGIIPVVFLVNLLGDSDYLYQAIRPVLERDKIAFLSSHTIASPADPRKYLRDSHFTPAIDDEMARALEDIINRSDSRSHSD